MNNISNFCLTLNPEHEEMIRNLSYIPVGLGERVFSKNCLSDKTETQYIKKSILWGVYFSLLDLEKLFEKYQNRMGWILPVQKIFS